MINTGCNRQDGFALSLTASEATGAVAWAIAVNRAAPHDHELRLRWLPHLNFPAAAGRPMPGEIVFWLAAVSASDEGATSNPAALTLERGVALLDVREKNHLARFRQREDQRSYLAAHAGARLVLGHVVGRPPNALQFGALVMGKPVLLLEPHEVDFSLSHARGVVAVAAALMPIGVDVEPLRDVDDLDSTSELVLAGEEQAVLRKASKVSRSRLFLRYWTLKEALLKAAGLGLAVAPNELVIDAGPRPMVLSVPAVLEPAAQWQFIAPPDT